MATPDRPTRTVSYVVRLGLLFTALQLGYAFTVPAFSGPDEPEHRQFVQALLETHRLPVLGELPTDVLGPEGYRVGVGTRPTGLSGRTTPQAQQPPLAYLVYAVVEAGRRMVGLSDVWLRLGGLVWGWIAIAALAALGRELFDDRPLVRDGLPASVLFPGPVYLCAVVSNDGAALAAGAVILWRLLRGLREPYRVRDLALLGLAVGCGLAIKSTVLVYLPVALFAALAYRPDGPRRWWAPLLVLGVALLPVAWWWHHNHALYGAALVRAHARPTLMSIPHTIQYSRDLFGDGIVLTASLLTVSFTWLPTCVAPLWLLLGWPYVTLALSIVCWAVAILGLLGPWRKPGVFQPAQRLARRYCLALLGLLFVLYLQQFLFQDYLVSLFAGRYFLTVYGALLLPLLSGCSVSLGEHETDRTGRRLAWLGVAGSLLCWPMVVSPPGG